MKITLAENAGFCFGVSRAVEEVYRLSEPGHKGRICTVGSLIHNPHIISELSSRGVEIISPDDFASLAEGASEENPCTVVTRTHGVSKDISEALAVYAEKNPYFIVCDMTCPYVKKIHRLVSENRDRHLVVFGDASHPEVQGIVSYAESTPTVLPTPEAAEALSLGNLPVVAVAQTTQSTSKWKKFQKKKFKNEFKKC